MFLKSPDPNFIHVALWTLVQLLKGKIVSHDSKGVLMAKWILLLILDHKSNPNYVGMCTRTHLKCFRVSRHLPMDGGFTNFIPIEFDKSRYYM